MAADLTLYGFDGSTYVRAVRMLLAEKGASYDQVPVNVLTGEPRQAEHRERHPFGKVPVIEHNGLRIYETGAIVRYLDAVLPGRSLQPDFPRDRVRQDMAMGIHDSYGYGALLSVVAYHLFPDFVGGKNEEARRNGIETGKLVLGELMRLRGGDPWIAGSARGFAEFYVAPVCFYVSLTPDVDEVFAIDGFADWWQRVRELDSYKATEPNLG